MLRVTASAPLTVARSIHNAAARFPERVAIESGAQDFMAKAHVTGQMLFRAVRFAIARQRKVMGFQAAADSDPSSAVARKARA